MSVTQPVMQPSAAVNPREFHPTAEPTQTGGRGGIRTHVRIAPKPDFESGAFNHSATLPLDNQSLANIETDPISHCTLLLYPLDFQLVRFHTTSTRKPLIFRSQIYLHRACRQENNLESGALCKFYQPEACPFQFVQDVRVRCAKPTLSDSRSV